VRVRLVLVGSGLAGLLLATGLIAWFGAADVMAALIATGWRGIAAVALVHLCSTVCCAIAWRALTPLPAPRLARLVYARWVREAVGNLLGLLPVAGEIVAVRLLTVEGLQPKKAAASVIADMTTETLGQLAFTLIGVFLLAVDRLELATTLVLAVLSASIPAALTVAIARDRRALALVERAAQGFARSLKLWFPASEGSLAESVHAVIRDRRAVIFSFLFHLVAWAIGGFEVWLALSFMGHRMALEDALAMEALMWAMRSAAFVVPSGLGVQESSYVLFGALFGIDPGTALAVSLVKRARDLLLGIPALLAWQVSEGGRFGK